MSSYIHYGHNKYNPDIVRKTKIFVNEQGSPVFFSNGEKLHPEYVDDGRDLNSSGRGDKPRYGLWASPTDADYGWRQWIESEDFRVDEYTQSSFEFDLSSGARILHIYSEDDIMPFIIKDKEFGMFFMSKTAIGDRIDFDRIAGDYDGLELHLSDNYGELHDSIFYTWDCDSIVIWNPDVIIPR